MATETLTELQTLDELIERLGNVPLDRIRLRPAPGTATEQDVLEAEQKGHLCELVDGVLVEKAMAYVESVLTQYLGYLLMDFILSRNLGVLTGEAGMMRLFPGMVRIPDLAFASWERFPDRKLPKKPIPDVVPDLAVEVLSRSNTPGEMTRKRRDYFEAGVRLVWIVSPTKRTVDVYTSPESFVTLDETDVLDGGDVLPGFSVPLATLFSYPTAGSGSPPE